MDREEEEAALFDKAECCCEAANNTCRAKKTLKLTVFCSDNLNLLTIELTVD